MATSTSHVVFHSNHRIWELYNSRQLITGISYCNSLAGIMWNMDRIKRKYNLNRLGIYPSTKNFLYLKLHAEGIPHELWRYTTWALSPTEVGNRKEQTRIGTSDILVNLDPLRVVWEEVAVSTQTVQWKCVESRPDSKRASLLWLFHSVPAYERSIRYDRYCDAKGFTRRNMGNMYHTCKSHRVRTSTSEGLEITIT